MIIIDVTLALLLTLR